MASYQQMPTTGCSACRAGNLPFSQSRGPGCPVRSVKRDDARPDFRRPDLERVVAAGLDEPLELPVGDCVTVQEEGTDLGGDASAVTKHDGDAADRDQRHLLAKDVPRRARVGIIDLVDGFLQEHECIAVRRRSSVLPCRGSHPAIGAGPRLAPCCAGSCRTSAEGHAAAELASDVRPPERHPTEESGGPARRRRRPRARSGETWSPKAESSSHRPELGRWGLIPRVDAGGVVLKFHGSGLSTFLTRSAASPGRSAARRCTGFGIVGGSPERPDCTRRNRPRPIGSGSWHPVLGSAGRKRPSGDSAAANEARDSPEAHSRRRSAACSTRSQASASKRRSSSSCDIEAIHSCFSRSAWAWSRRRVSSSSADFFLNDSSSADNSRAGSADARCSRASVSIEFSRSSTSSRNRSRSWINEAWPNAPEPSGAGTRGLAARSPACEDH